MPGRKLRLRFYREVRVHTGPDGRHAEQVYGAETEPIPVREVRVRGSGRARPYRRSRAGQRAAQIAQRPPYARGRRRGRR